MSTKPPFPMYLKLIISSFLSLLVITIFFITRTTFSPSSFQTPSILRISNSIETTNLQNQESQRCSKIPPSMADALLHYAASNFTPQQTLSEISVTKKVLDKKSPCNFLVFGLGHDSLMWATLNHNGRTIFLDEDKSWIHQISKKFPSLESYHVHYNTKVKNAADLMAAGREKEECRRIITDPKVSECELTLKGLPSVVYELEWDMIMVDAPTGFHDEAPGRMTAIYTAGVIARRRKGEESVDVFVHDVNRRVEDEFSMEFLCRAYLIEQQGLLRHFTVLSHRVSGGKLCP